jgi:hypothetical protein
LEGTEGDKSGRKERSRWLGEKVGRWKVLDKRTDWEWTSARHRLRAGEGGHETICSRDLVLGGSGVEWSGGSLEEIQYTEWIEEGGVMKQW